MLVGTDDAAQTFGDLAVALEDWRGGKSLTVLCQGDTVERLLGVAALDYQQLRITERRAALTYVVDKAIRVVVSRCEPRSVSLASQSTQRPSTNAVINLRMDLMQPVDTFAAAHKLLAKLKTH